ncbi:MAG: methionine ABC transporter permease [Gammaproteobacteria bacterium]
MSQEMLWQLINATLETLMMVGVATLFATLFGLPLGVILYLTRKNHLAEQKTIHQTLGLIVNIGRSIPFIILMIAVIPFTRLIIGTSIGSAAATVPLTLAAIPFIARLFENALLEIHKGLVEAAVAMGANTWQIILKVLLPEALPGIINAIVITIIALIGYSAMAGTVGGGGLGDLAIRYGYQRFDIAVMLETIVILVLMVQVVQWIGDGFVKRLTRRTS